MKLRTLLLTTVLVASQVAATMQASAEKKHESHSDEYYAKIEAGVTIPERLRITYTTIRSSDRIRTRNSFVGGLGAGYSINEFFRTDLILQYREIRSRRSYELRGSAFTAILNGYVDGHNDTIFTPYLMAGVGAGHNTTRIREIGRFRRTNFVWNVGLGAQAKVDDQLSLDLGYRYASLGRLGSRTLDGQRLSFRRDLRSQEVVAGLIWRF